MCVQVSGAKASVGASYGPANAGVSGKIPTGWVNGTCVGAGWTKRMPADQEEYGAWGSYPTYSNPKWRG